PFVLSSQPLKGAPALLGPATNGDGVPAQAAIRPKVSLTGTALEKAATEERQVPQLPLHSARGSDTMSRSAKSPRSVRSARSITPPPNGSSLSSKVQGMAGCTLCHALLQLFAGKIRIQTFTNSSQLPAPPSHLVDRALSYELAEEEDVQACATFCRLHNLHKSRFELWMRGQEAIRRCTARGDQSALCEATTLIRKCAEEIGKLDSMAGKVEREYVETFATFFRHLQQDVRENLFRSLMGKANELVSAWQSEIDEVNQQIDAKMKQKKKGVKAAVNRRYETTKEDFMRQQEQSAAKQFVSCLVSNCRNMQIGRADDAFAAFKDLELSQQAQRHNAEILMESRASTKVDAERAKREREMSTWLGKLDQLQTLQHVQACKDRELVYLRVAMTIRRLEEDQGVEHRLVTARARQHVEQMRTFLEKTLRTSGVCSNMDMMGITPGSIVLESESFIHMVLRNERVLGDAISTPRSLSVGATAREGESAASTRTGGSNPAASLELRAFAEFLGARFPSLRAALSGMDLTGTGRVACFELESWLRQHMYPGNARVLLKDLGRRGSLGLGHLRVLAPGFVHSGRNCGRPSGAGAASLVRCFWGHSDPRMRKQQPSKALQSAISCCRSVCSFLDSSISAGLTGSLSQELNDTASVGTGRLGQVSTVRSMASLAASERSVGSRSKLEAVRGDVDKRTSSMHFRRSQARTSTRDKSIPRNLRADHAARRDAELSWRLGPLPRCIATIRGRNTKQRVASPPRSRSGSPRRSRTSSPIRRLVEVFPEVKVEAHVEEKEAEAPKAVAVPPGAQERGPLPAGEERIVHRSIPRLASSPSADTLPAPVRAQLPVPSGRVIVRSPSAPVVVRRVSVGSGISSQPVTPPAPALSHTFTSREASPRVHWDSTVSDQSATPRLIVTSTSPRSMMSASPVVSGGLVKAVSLPTAPLLPITVTRSVSALSSPRFFVAGPGSTPVQSAQWRPFQSGTPVASVAATWARPAAFNEHEKMRRAS
ncbi:unnamed protein product, partial [Effrenium voratum]